MERAVAIKKLGKILGKSLGYRINPKAPTQDEREAARLELPAAIKERNELNERRDARRRAILEADEEFQLLMTSYSAARDRVDRLSSVTRHHKITVGISSGMFFHVKAEGDSWEEIIDKLATAKQAA